MKRIIKINESELRELLNKCVTRLFEGRHSIASKYTNDSGFANYGWNIDTRDMTSHWGLGNNVIGNNGNANPSGINLNTGTFQDERVLKVSETKDAWYHFILAYRKYGNRMLVNYNAATKNKIKQILSSILRQKDEDSKQNLIKNELYPALVNVLPEKYELAINSRAIRNCVKLALIITGNVNPQYLDNILGYWSQEETKLGSVRDSARKKKDNLNYYLGIVPGTNVKFMSLFPFSDFGGTEIIKAGRVSLRNAEIRKAFGQDVYTNGTDKISGDVYDTDSKKYKSLGYKPGWDKFMPLKFKGTENPEDAFNPWLGDNANGAQQIETGSGSAQEFINYSLQHAHNVFKKINFEPNFIISVPSTAKFNENYIQSFSKTSQNGCEALPTFIVKNWVGFQLTNESKQKLQQYLQYINYTSGNGTEMTDTIIKGLEGKFKLGAKQSLMYNMNQCLTNNMHMFDYSSLTNNMKQFFLRYFTEMVCRKNKNFADILQPKENNNNNNRFGITKINPQDIGNDRMLLAYYNYCLATLESKPSNNRKIANEVNVIVNDIIRVLNKFIPSNVDEMKEPLRIQLNPKDFYYADSDVQMTTIASSGPMFKGVPIEGSLLRPLFLDVYVLNLQEYELPQDVVERLRQSLQQPGPMNERVKLDKLEGSKRLVIFDDDMDSGTSLKLAINAIQKYKFQGLQLMCFTLFNKLEFSTRKTNAEKGKAEFSNEY